MTKLEKVIKALELCTSEIETRTQIPCETCPYHNIKYHGVLGDGCCNTLSLQGDILTLLKEQMPQWRPFVKRALTEEEQKHHPDWCYILDGEVPGDDEEILLYRPWNNKAGYIIEMDTYCNNGNECYLDGAGDIENGMYWMQLPEPPKEGDGE